MGTILVPLDGSDMSERALPFAVRLARETGGTLLLVRAALAYVYESERISDVVRLDHGAQPELDEVAQKVRAMNVTVETSVAHGVSAADSIVGLACERAVDLIVMSSHGRGGLGRFIYGSVADRVLRNAPAPVLMITGGTHHLWREGTIRALMPLDGSALSGRSLLTLGTLARAMSIEAVLLRVIEPPPPDATLGFPPTYAVPMPMEVDGQVLHARGALDDEAQRVRGTVPIVGVRVEVGQVAPTIATVAAEEKVDLIVMSTHGRGGISRMVMGSAATAMMQRATVPLLLVPHTVRTRAVLAPTDPRRRPRPKSDVTVTLTPLQVGYVEYGLEMVLHSADDRASAEEVQGLLATFEAFAEPSEMVPHT